ncbi:DUF4831 family protein [Porphyromonas levii]|uniref:DUF4831 family protein n=1 Tax=Porphyromonas levii TaxID=28114 RepID=UPI0003823BCB|nr:DUF4831 family protein [Porphyromonas levii]MBR8703105.1 hypothetical protein [Porphyromonas levii]MBR8713700.1 hypothetical protein [Porphyromonas levii]MBR8715734.1 hypothetical protein [Porphyromonas levii]MBR8728261.1 hypothetical protein [Porphyromonas levii]MBR8729575.1 hypothetical protein [Porphyromonas levii]
MMRINRILAAVIVSLVLWSGSAAQRVERYSVAALNDNRVVYALPLTHLYLQVELEKVIEQPGELSLYAERFLGSRDAIIEPATYYQLKGLNLGAYGVADPDQRYSIDFKKNSTATDVSLTKEGILIGVNVNTTDVVQLPETKKPMIGRTDDLSSRMLPPEYIQATTIAAKAQILADEIYRTRESRNLVISGESEQPFADGEALKIAVERLDQRERAFMGLFNGIRQSAEGVEVVANLSATEEGHRVVARFSEQLGLLTHDDLRGEPIYLDLEIIEQAPQLEEREQSKLQKRLEKGITYRVPGLVRATVTFRGERMVSKEIPVAQLGSLEALDMVLFTTKGKNTSVEFYPSNGGLKEVREIHQ